MLLKFEGQAITDSAGDVRFAGQYDADGKTRIVICRVERAALVARMLPARPDPGDAAGGLP